MNPHSTHTASKKPPVPVFLAAVVMIFFCSLSSADSIGFVPDYIDGTAPASADSVALSSLPQLGETADAPAATSAVGTKGTASAQGVLPKRIIIAAADIDLPIQNPSTHDVDALDTLLQNGPARYVDSAKLGQPGNLLIFAHSSHLPIVHNQMFRAFNNIPNLKAGDSITIVGEDGKNYLYSVTSVSKADVDDGTSIDLSTTQGTKLTLVTCDTLTGKSARFVLSAVFIGISGTTQ